MMGQLTGARKNLKNLKNVVWLEKKVNAKADTMQWIDPDFSRIWEKSLYEAFEILGLPPEFFQVFEEKEGLSKLLSFPRLKTVVGVNNRLLLKQLMLGNGSESLRHFQMEEGFGVYYDGALPAALKDWRISVEIAQKATVQFWITQGLEFYVEGLDVGYPLHLRHLFQSTNTVEMVKSSDLYWRVTLSGNTTTVGWRWDDLKRIRKSSPQTAFQLIGGQVEDFLKRL